VTAVAVADARRDDDQPQADRAAVVEAVDVSMAFRDKLALDGVSLRVAAGEIHALLGPNGAGKTTLLRILAGLLTPSAGSVSLAAEAGATGRELRGRIGLVPSGDRTFYLRLSALENLVFFGRLQGLRRREAQARALEKLAQVGLEGRARTRVAELSHGMQKRLSIARGLLADPPVLLVDEATHDLDPEGARRVRDLVRETAAAQGIAVLWATQRLEEIRGFAGRVSLLAAGEIRFVGSVNELLERSVPRRYVVRVLPRPALVEAARAALAGHATVELAEAAPSPHLLIVLREHTVLGHALAALSHAGVDVVACRQERPEIEEAFVALTEPSA
jgi:ABC-2 type transport system ATP-binding protein